MDYNAFHLSELMFEGEPLYEYEAGGFHPVCIGDTFKDGRYRIRHKLGYGGSATVWLARDLEYYLLPG